MRRIVCPRSARAFPCRWHLSAPPPGVQAEGNRHGSVLAIAKNRALAIPMLGHKLGWEAGCAREIQDPHACCIINNRMDSLTPEYLAELGRQLAAIAAFLGGFSITFFGTLLTIKSSRGISSWALGAAAVAAGSFSVTVIAVTMLITSLHPGAPSYAMLSGHALARAQIVTALSLTLGILSLLLSLSFSGWMHSRKLGIATSFTCQLHRKNHLNELEVPSAGHSRLSKALPLDCTSGEVLQRRSVLGQGAVAKRAGQG